MWLSKNALNAMKQIYFKYMKMQAQKYTQNTYRKQHNEFCDLEK